MAVPLVPEVESFSPDVTVANVVAALKRAGGCIIRNYVSRQDLDQIQTDLRPHLEADIPWQGDFFPPETRRAYGIVGKSLTVAQCLPMSDLYREVCREFLEEHSVTWSGSKQEHNVSKPQLNNSIAFSIRPGAKAQPLHRDDMCHMVRNKTVQIYPEDAGQARRDNLVGLFVAGKPTTKQNGATRFIPGSHLWSTEQPPDENLAVYAELAPGDAFIMLGSAYHGGSANTTAEDERLVYSCFVTRGYLRQEENQYLSIPMDVVKTWPVELQQLVGYQLSEPFCGWVNSKDPRSVIDTSIKTISA